MSELKQAGLRLLLPAVILGWLLWPMHSADFGLIDDHELAAAIGPSSHLPPRLWLPTLADGLFEPVGRFRPVYWFGRVGEMVVFGQHPALWYGFRYLLALITMAAVLVAIGKAPVVAASLAAVVLVAGPQSEIWYRLGPNETYACALAAVAVAWWMVRRRRGGAVGVAGSLGPLLLLVAAGLSKESFLAFAPLAFVALILERRPVPSRRRERIMVAAVGGLLAVVGLIFAWKLHSYGDVYGTTRTVAGVRSALEQFFRGSVELYAWPLVAVMALLRVPRRHVLLAIAVIVAVFVTQAIFYAGSPPPAGRYWLPVIAGAVIGIGLLRTWPTDRFLRVGITASLVLCAGFTMQTALDYRSEAERWAARTNAFQASLAALDQADVPLVFVTTNVLRDYEPIVSTARWLRARGNQNQFSLVAYNVEPGLSSSLHEALRSGRAGGINFASLPEGACLAVLIVLDAGSAPCTDAFLVDGL